MDHICIIQGVERVTETKIHFDPGRRPAFRDWGSSRGIHELAGKIESGRRSEGFGRFGAPLLVRKPRNSGSARISAIADAVSGQSRHSAPKVHQLLFLLHIHRTSRFSSSSESFWEQKRQQNPENTRFAKLWVWLIAGCPKPVWISHKAVSKIFGSFAVGFCLPKRTALRSSPVLALCDWAQNRSRVRFLIVCCHG